MAWRRQIMRGCLQQQTSACRQEAELVRGQPAPWQSPKQPFLGFLSDASRSSLLLDNMLQLHQAGFHAGD